eukprot:7430964-Pyramimonas_sp.AAC.1
MQYLHTLHSLHYSIREKKRCRLARHLQTWIPFASRGARLEHIQSSRCGASWEPLGSILEASWG